MMDLFSFEKLSCKSPNQLPALKWSVSLVTNHTERFRICKQLTLLMIGQWPVTLLTDKHNTKHC